MRHPVCSTSKMSVAVESISKVKTTRNDQKMTFTSEMRETREDLLVPVGINMTSTSVRLSNFTCGEKDSDISSDMEVDKNDNADLMEGINFFD